jgi:ABC-2 type transport system permease protein
MKIAVIAWTNLVRTARDRLGLFFIVLLPMIIIITLGITFGGQGSARVGVTNSDGGPLATALVESIAATDEAQIVVVRYQSERELQDAVSRGHVQVGLAIAAGYDAALRSGGTGMVDVLAPPTTASSAVRSSVERAIAAQAALVEAARFAASTNGVSFERALSAAATTQQDAAGVSVAVVSVAQANTSRANSFSVGAQSQLILFMFLTSLTGATELIVTRQLGVSRRMLASPTGPWTIIIGEGLGRFGLAVFQGAFIVVASWALFRVDWVDPLATVVIVILFALLSAGAAMAIGTIASNPSQAGALGAAAGLLLGLLGGTMVPTEVFPTIMRTIAHITPHAWAMDAFRALVYDHASLGGILPQLSVLAAFAVVFGGLAVYRFRSLLRSGAI